MYDRTRAKFVCVQVEDYGQSEKVVLSAVYEGPIGPNEENRRFHLASPYGRFEITIDNPKVRGFYVKDAYYYLETVPAPVDGDG